MSAARMQLAGREADARPRPRFGGRWHARAVRVGRVEHLAQLIRRRERQRARQRVAGRRLRLGHRRNELVQREAARAVVVGADKRLAQPLRLARPRARDPALPVVCRHGRRDGLWPRAVGHTRTPRTRSTQCAEHKAQRSQSVARPATSSRLWSEARAGARRSLAVSTGRRRWRFVGGAARTAIIASRVALFACG